MNDLISKLDRMAQQGELQVDVVLDLRQQRKATSGWNYFAGYSGSRRLYWQQSVHWNSSLLFVSNISSTGHMMGLIVNDDKVKYTDIAVRSATPPWELTCHIRSHSIRIMLFYVCLSVFFLEFLVQNIWAYSFRIEFSDKFCFVTRFTALALQKLEKLQRFKVDRIFGALCIYRVRQKSCPLSSVVAFLIFGAQAR